MPDTPETEGRRSGRARHSGPSEWWNSPATGRQALPFNKFLVGLQFPTARTRGAGQKTPGKPTAPPSPARRTDTRQPAPEPASPAQDNAGESPASPAQPVAAPATTSAQHSPTDLDFDIPPSDHEPEPNNGSPAEEPTAFAGPFSDSDSEPEAPVLKKTQRRRPSRKDEKRSKSRKAASSKSKSKQRAQDSDGDSEPPPSPAFDGPEAAGPSRKQPQPQKQQRAKVSGSTRAKGSTGAQLDADAAVAAALATAGRPKRATAQLALHRMRGDAAAAPPDLFAPRQRATELLAAVTTAPHPATSHLPTGKATNRPTLKPLPQASREPSSSPKLRRSKQRKTATLIRHHSDSDDSALEDDMGSDGEGGTEPQSPTARRSQPTQAQAPSQQGAGASKGSKGSRRGKEDGAAVGDAPKRAVAAHSGRPRRRAQATPRGRVVLSGSETETDSEMVVAAKALAATAKPTQRSNKDAVASRKRKADTQADADTDAVATAPQPKQGSRVARAAAAAGAAAAAAAAAAGSGELASAATAEGTAGPVPALVEASRVKRRKVQVTGASLLSLGSQGDVAQPCRRQASDRTQPQAPADSGRTHSQAQAHSGRTHAQAPSHSGRSQPAARADSGAPRSNKTASAPHVAVVPDATLLASPGSSEDRVAAAAPEASAGAQAPQGAAVGGDVAGAQQQAEQEGVVGAEENVDHGDAMDVDEAPPHSPLADMQPSAAHDDAAQQPAAVQQQQQQRPPSAIAASAGAPQLHGAAAAAAAAASPAHSGASGSNHHHSADAALPDQHALALVAGTEHVSQDQALAPVAPGAVNQAEQVAEAGQAEGGAEGASDKQQHLADKAGDSRTKGGSASPQGSVAQSSGFRPPRRRAPGGAHSPHVLLPAAPSPLPLPPPPRREPGQGGGSGAFRPVRPLGAAVARLPPLRPTSLLPRSLGVREGGSPWQGPRMSPKTHPSQAAFSHGHHQRMALAASRHRNEDAYALTDADFNGEDPNEFDNDGNELATDEGDAVSDGAVDSGTAAPHASHARTAPAGAAQDRSHMQGPQQPAGRYSSQQQQQQQHSVQLGAQRTQRRAPAGRLDPPAAAHHSAHQRPPPHPQAPAHPDHAYDATHDAYGDGQGQYEHNTDGVGGQAYDYNPADNDLVGFVDDEPNDLQGFENGHQPTDVYQQGDAYPEMANDFGAGLQGEVEFGESEGQGMECDVGYEGVSGGGWGSGGGRMVAGSSGAQVLERRHASRAGALPAAQDLDTWAPMPPPPPRPPSGTHSHTHHQKPAASTARQPQRANTDRDNLSLGTMPPPPPRRQPASTGLIIPAALPPRAAAGAAAAASQRPLIAAPALKRGVASATAPGAPRLALRAGSAAAAGGGMSVSQGAGVSDRTRQLLAQQAAQATRPSGGRGRGSAGPQVPEGWTVEQLRALHHAMNQVEPQHPRFWQEVAAYVPGRTAGECFACMQDQYKTPEARARLPGPTRLAIGPATTRGRRGAAAAAAAAAEGEGSDGEDYEDAGDEDANELTTANNAMQANLGPKVTGRKPTTTAALRWAREQQNALLLERLASAPAGTVPTQLAQAIEQKKRADGVITNFFRHTGGYNKWQKVTRQQSDRRYAESIAALQSGLNSGPQSATSSITNAVHHALQEAQNLNADLEDEEYLRDADFYTPLDMQEEETDNLMMMDAL